jgi:hypothetical protein
VLGSALSLRSVENLDQSQKTGSDAAAAGAIRRNFLTVKSVGPWSNFNDQPRKGTTGMDGKSHSSAKRLESAASSPAAKPFVHRIWPLAVVGFGLGLTSVWIFVLAYGTIQLIDKLIDTTF